MPALGAAALELLDPQPGEHILDVGCGDGTLTLKIKEMGADVVGIDNSLSMIGAARAKGLDARLMDAAQLKFAEAFDAAFSNATLHWVLDKERAARAIWFALKHGGRFAGEMGGDGQSRRACAKPSTTNWSRAASGRRPMPPTGIRRPRNSPPSTSSAGFKDIDARLIERPTPLEHGVAGLGDRRSAPAGSTAPACPTRNASPSPKPSPTASAPTSPIMSAFASS